MGISLNRKSLSTSTTHTFSLPSFFFPPHPLPPSLPTPTHISGDFKQPADIIACLGRGQGEVLP